MKIAPIQIKEVLIQVMIYQQMIQIQMMIEVARHVKEKEQKNKTNVALKIDVAVIKHGMDQINQHQEVAVVVVIANDQNVKEVKIKKNQYLPWRHQLSIDYFIVLLCKDNEKNRMF